MRVAGYGRSGQNNGANPNLSHVCPSYSRVPSCLPALTHSNNAWVRPSCVSIVILTAYYTHIKNNDCIIITSIDCFVIKLCPRIFTFLLEITNFIKM